MKGINLGGQFLAASIPRSPTPDRLSPPRLGVPNPAMVFEFASARQIAPQELNETPPLQHSPGESALRRFGSPLPFRPRPAWPRRAAFARQAALVHLLVGDAAATATSVVIPPGRSLRARAVPAGIRERANCVCSQRRYTSRCRVSIFASCAPIWQIQALHGRNQSRVWRRGDLSPLWSRAQPDVHRPWAASDIASVAADAAGHPKPRSTCGRHGNF